MKITIKDIAREAGVSSTTVSNVINNKNHRVSDKNIIKIRELMETYNYSPNMNARSLVTSESKLVALIHYSEESRVISFGDPFISQLLSGVEEKAKEKGYFILIRNITNIKEIGELQKNWNIQGIIIIGLLQRYFLKVSELLLIPTVFIDTYIPNELLLKATTIENKLFLNSDDFKGMEKSTQYLIDHGHRKIAFLSYNNTDSGVIMERLSGYKSALNSNNIAFTEELICLVPSSDCIVESDEFNELVESIGKFTAVVTTADILAANLIHSAKQKNYNLPEDLSIVGFDNIPFAKLLSPPLTTIHQDLTKKGKRAMELLLHYFAPDNYTSKVERHINLPVELVVRSSVSSIGKY
jgi:LacI family transcriptional regulator